MQITIWQIVAAVAASVAAIFAALTWWRGRHRAAPDLLLTVDGWLGFRDHDGERDAYGNVNNTLYGTLANVGNAPAHAIRVEVDGGAAYTGGEYSRELPSPVPLLRDGDTLRVVIVVRAPIERVRMTVTWGQPPNASRRRGPKRWDLHSLAPEGWTLNA